MKRQLLFAVKFITITGVYLFTRSRTPENKIPNPAKSIAVLFVLENLKRVLVYNARLIRNAKSEVKMLDNDISLFKALLEDLTNIEPKDEALEELLGQIQDLIYEAERKIVVFSNLEDEITGRNFFQRTFADPMKLIGVAKEIRAIRAKVKIIYDKVNVVYANRPICTAAP